jgi:hypothetical protein
MGKNKGRISETEAERRILQSEKDREAHRRTLGLSARQIMAEPTGQEPSPKQLFVKWSRAAWL